MILKKILLTLLIVLGCSTPIKEEHVYMPREIAVEDTANRPDIDTLPAKEVKRYSVILTGYDNDYACTQSGKGITANGVRASRGTMAAPSSIPFGTQIKIENAPVGVYPRRVVEDRGGAIQVKNNVYHFDVWFKTHKEALNFGVKKGYMTYENNTIHIYLEGSDD
jgi:3D (Asp-Asp-Asp) domain-containing protein